MNYFLMLLICILFVHTDNSIFQYSFQTAPYSLFCGSEGKIWAQRQSFFLRMLKHNQDGTDLACMTPTLGHAVWTKLGAPGMFQAAPDNFEWLPVILPWSYLSLPWQRAFSCVLWHKITAAQKTWITCCIIRSIKAHERNNRFPTPSFPLPPFKNKIEAPGTVFLCRCRSTTSSPDL